MIISRDDPRFWDVRTRDRRLRRNEMTTTEAQAHMDGLPDVADKSTISTPLEEPDERRLLRQVQHPRIIPPNPDDILSDDELAEYDDEDDDDDLDDDDDDDDDDDGPLK